ncbi:MLP-like protein 423, partial [Linum perenne]
NDYWGGLFASTYFFPKANEDLYTSINVVKGDGYSQHSLREINFVRGLIMYRTNICVGTHAHVQWKDWVEEIMQVDHEKKTIEWSVMHGGPLTTCGFFNTTVMVKPRARNPKDHGAVVKWTIHYDDKGRGFNLEEMNEMVKSTLMNLDVYLSNVADRESSRGY